MTVEKILEGVALYLAGWGMVLAGLLIAWPLRWLGEKAMDVALGLYEVDNEDI